MYELLKGQYRADKTSTPLRTLRQNGFVPGTIYGKGFSPVSFQVPGNALKKFLTHSGKIFQFEIDGYGTHLVNLDKVQYDHFGTQMLHIAFHKISENTETMAELPIVLTGTAIGIKAGGIIQHILQTVQVKGLPKDFPDHIEIDISNLDLHDHLCLSDITPPKGLKWTHDLHDNVVSCHTPRLQVVSETEEKTPKLVGEEAEIATTASEEVKKAS